MSVRDRPRKIKYDLTGQKFGRLTVLKINEEKNDFDQIYWDCQCECGNIVPVSTANLRDGTSMSCGCLRIENSIKSRKKTNTYDLSGEYGIGYTTNTNKPFMFDKEDFDKICNMAWRENRYGYIVSSNKSDNIYLHRVIMDCCDTDIEVDHINHDKTDNRHRNLRLCSHQQNNYNKGISKYNTSGYSGVGWDKRTSRWRARIYVGGKDIYLGLFENIEDAIKARKEAEIKYFKEFRFKGEN